MENASVALVVPRSVYDCKRFVGIRATDRPKHVAFSSYLDHKMKMVQIDQIIKFDKMVLNDGNGYNNNTGKICLILN